MTGSSWRPTVSSMVVKSIWRSSPGPLHGSFCSLAMGRAPSYFLQRAQFFTLLIMSRVIPGHHNCSCIREMEQRWPSCAASWWQPSNTTPQCDLGTIKCHRSSPVLVRWVEVGFMIQQTISEYQPIPPLLISLSSLGIEDFTHSPHEIFFRGSQVFNESIENGVLSLSFLPVHHLQSAIFDWAS